MKSLMVFSVQFFSGIANFLFLERGLDTSLRLAQFSVFHEIFPFFLKFFLNL